jgi:outer membrane lipoprotein-sorting protein
MPRLLAAICALALSTGVLLGCGGVLIAPPPDALSDAPRVLELAQSYLGTGPSAAVIEARASHYSDRGGIKGKVEILVERPGRVRFTGLSPTDDMVSVISTDGERFVAYERGARDCHVGRACAANVGRFASIPLEADELAGVLVGRPPVIPYAELTLDWDRAAGAYRLELTGGARDLGLAHGRVQRLWVTHPDGRVIRTTILDGGRTRVDVRYSDFRRVGEHTLPHRLDIQLERDSTDLRLDFRDIELPADLDDAAFSFACPASTTLEELPCGLEGSP